MEPWIFEVQLYELIKETPGRIKNWYLSNSITSKFKRQKLTELPGETEKFTKMGMNFMTKKPDKIFEKNLNNNIGADFCIKSKLIIKLYN